MSEHPTPPLHPEIFEILLALANGALHGYGIVKAVEENTGGEISLAPSLLYRRLRRLQDDGLVAEGEET
ncbi:MAG TPA: helix-turn-helix transcriptional regulator, partial [Longimicrobiales bacterium]|nr:helix-turn-helix transcriptional regulator [Longimicrobiales bacterium]